MLTILLFAAASALPLQPHQARVVDHLGEPVEAVVAVYDAARTFSAIADRGGRVMAPASAELMVVATYEGLRSEPAPLDGELTLVLPPSATLSGALVEGGVLTLVGAVEGRSIYRELDVDEDGRFSLSHLPEGDAEITLFADDEEVWSGALTLDADEAVALGDL